VTGLVASGKRENFERRREKTKNDMTIYTYGTQNLLLLYLFIFNILYKETLFYSVYPMNKSNIFFKPLFLIIYLFIKT